MSKSRIYTRFFTPPERMIFKVLKSHEGKTLSRPLKYSDQKSKNHNENNKIYIEAFRGDLDSDPLLKEVLISRMWEKLSVMEKMKVHAKCTDLSLNNNKNFWDLRNTEKSNRDWYSLAIKICQSDSTADLIPYIDTSILNEYAFYLHENSEALSRIYGLCEAWPQASLKTVKPLPSISRNRLLLNYAEFKQADNYYENGEAINLFNGYENSKLTEDEQEAISAYTGDSYDPINAYQSWGRVGLYFQRRRERENSENNGERGEEQGYDDEGVERDIPALTKNLKSALGKLDHFDGVSFGAHQLNSHIFTRIRKGGHFEPGFFMSTSTNRSIAEGFLEIPEGQLTEEQKEEVKGYLFVVKNKSGKPLENLSLYPGEYEVLLDPESKYRVLDMEPYLHEGEELPNVKIVYIEEY
ncbi:MAG: ADP-ribosyltransferase [Bdellovibrionota bacterium]|nr:ADP-ribosyltransferase [Bdellovibrionota bacterium]